MYLRAITFALIVAATALAQQEAQSGSAVEQAARTALANSPIEVLSDTNGVDFGPYLQHVLHDVRENWHNLIPEIARPPIMKQGKLAIEFAILKDGRIAGMRLVAPSGDVTLDRAAWGGITGSNPFPPLPAEFGGKYLALRFHFSYNPSSGSGTTVSIVPHTRVQVRAGSSEVFSATVKGTTKTDVTWKVTGTGCSGTACGTMTEGLYVAPSVLPSPPSVTITASLQSDPSAYDSVTVDLLPVEKSSEKK